MARIEKISLFPLKEQELFDTLFLEFQLCKPARLKTNSAQFWPKTYHDVAPSPPPPPPTVNKDR